MKSKLHYAHCLILLLGLLVFESATSTTVTASSPAMAPLSSAPAPMPTPELPLNQMRVGQCDVQNLDGLIRDESKRGLVMDARPFAVNQATGKLSFGGSTGRVTVLNMNPFAYSYTITVAQKEMVSTAINDFLKPLLPPTLGSAFLSLQSGTDTITGLKDSRTREKLTQIGKRLDDMKDGQCKISADPAGNKPAACIAVGAMYEIYNSLKDMGLLKGTGEEYLEITSSKIKKHGNLVAAKGEFVTYATSVATLRDQDADAHTACTNATTLNGTLESYAFADYFQRLKKAQEAIGQVTSTVSDLEGLVAAFKADKELADATPIRCKGYKCVDQFDEYATAARGVLTSYQAELDALRERAERMQKMRELTEKMKSKEGLFARTFTIIKKYEVSQATVSLNRVEISEQSAQSGKTQSGKEAQSGNSNSETNRTPPEPVVQGGVSSEGAGANTSNINNLASSGNQAGTPPITDKLLPAKASEEQNAATPATAGPHSEVVQIGRPRFVLSGGVVYSPLPRRTFQTVKGFARDAQGNPTGNGDANVVGFGENSSRRILPMVLLNSRLLSFESTSLFFSFGVSAKHDDNLDIEYLFGPSVSLLNDRALFTFGVYGGKTQNLVSDLKIGDELPDDIGNAKLFRKKYTWKPGFSFSYSFSRPPKAGTAGAGTGTTASSADNLRNEFQIGSIPFNLAVGLAYTSLEQRGYDPIVGYARDRQGNLTGGQVLTRIVGLSSSSNYRLTPLALLHSRLTNFGGRDFYFSTGITGKKTDNTFDIEYLLGGSVNLYGRKVFLTFGTFAGKQQLLGGDLFEGAKLSANQPVATQDRYVWKPAFAISYDITRIIPGK